MGVAKDKPHKNLIEYYQCSYLRLEECLKGLISNKAIGAFDQTVMYFFAFNHELCGFQIALQLLQLKVVVLL